MPNGSTSASGSRSEANKNSSGNNFAWNRNGEKGGEASVHSAARSYSLEMLDLIRIQHMCNSSLHLVRIVSWRRINNEKAACNTHAHSRRVSTRLAMRSRTRQHATFANPQFLAIFGRNHAQRCAFVTVLNFHYVAAANVEHAADFLVAFGLGRRQLLVVQMFTIL